MFFAPSVVKSALKNPNLTVVCFTAPSIRVSVSNELLDGDFKDCQGKINTALRLLGFDVVFDMNIGADFTIVEEAHEFVERLKTNTNLPLMTSCCPGWVNFIRKAYPEFVKNLSTCKSPQQMFGALISKYYAQSIGKKSTDLFVVSLVPCVIKKLEAREEDINASVGYDVDAVITTKDFIDLIRENNIDFKNLESSLFDDFFGTASGAGSIFGTTGGVMESALRTIGDSIDHEDLDEAMYKLVRGHDAIRRAEIPFKNKLIKVAVVSGLKNVKKLLESIKNGEELHFVEVMACEGGCVGGAGQPKHDTNIIKKRAKLLYSGADTNKKRKAHKNDSLIKIYNNHIGKIGNNEAINVLHRKFK